MDINRIIQTVKATLNPEQQKEAESYLSEMHKIIGFSPALLQIAMSGDIEIPARQAGVIYLKNLVTSCWHEREPEQPDDPIPFSIHEQDRAYIRQHLIEAIIDAPDPIRIQLRTSLAHIVKHDFPARWPDLPNKIFDFLKSSSRQHWLGALVSLYCLVKNYEYKKQDEREPFNESMKFILPLLQSHMTNLVMDNEEGSVLLQTMILKILYAYTQVHLAPEVVTKEAICHWVNLIRTVLERPLPDQTLQVEEESREELIWWKCKKWAVHILMRYSERYGSPGVVLKQYKQFAEWYLKSFSECVVNTLLKLCETYRQKAYVSPRVMYYVMSCFETLLSHAFSWKFMKAHFFLLVQEIIYPILCHSDEDDQLWKDDPIEYIRGKADLFGVLDPVAASESLLSEACGKRKGVLDATMQFCNHLLRNPECPPRQKDGALHMIGSVVSLLIKKKAYKTQIEPFVVNYVLPVVSASEGYLRARACWLLGQVVEAGALTQAGELMRRVAEVSHTCLCADPELPVRFAAATCMEQIIENNDVRDVLKPHLRQVLVSLLELLRTTENDDLNNVINVVISTYNADIIPVAVELTEHLAATFNHLMTPSDEDGAAASGDEYEDRQMTANGVLTTIKNVLDIMEDHDQIMERLEALVVPIVGSIFQHEVMDFYEDALSLVDSLTTARISPVMWQAFHLIHQAFERDAFDYFNDMMGCLVNYVRVDRQAFLANPNNMEVVFSMCSKVLQVDDAAEDSQCRAAKLLEILIIDLHAGIVPWVPKLIELALARLTRPILTSELRTMCLQVVIAAIYRSPAQVLDILLVHPWPGTADPILNNFLHLWIKDTDCFLGVHDRRMCVLGLCILLSFPPDDRMANALRSQTAQFMPSLLLLFTGLKRAYAVKAAEEKEEESTEEDEDDDGERKALESDEDDIDEESVQYLEMLENVDGQGDAAADGEDDDEDEDDGCDGETLLEMFETDLELDDAEKEEFVLFYRVMCQLRDSHPTWYQDLVGILTPEQGAQLHEALETAAKCIQQRESKRIEKAGGYSFQQTTVPNSFNFGASFPGNGSPFSGNSGGSQGQR